MGRWRLIGGIEDDLDQALVDRPLMELAYAVAKGKKVVGYLSKDETLVERHRKQGTAFERDGHYYDEHDRRIENFGNHVNLMVQHSVDELVFGEVKDALRYVYDTWMSEPSPVI